MKRQLTLLCLAAICACLMLLPATAQASERPDGWTDASHGNRAPINYDLILPDDRINQLAIVFTPEAWQAEEDDMIELYGDRRRTRLISRPEARRHARLCRARGTA